MQERKELIVSLIEFNRNITELIKDLRLYSWDSVPLVTLKRQHIINILKRFLNKDISSVELENKGQRTISTKSQDKKIAYRWVNEKNK